MRRLRPMPVPWLVSGHLEKLGKKFGKHKEAIDKWVSWFGERIEQKIAETYKQMGCVAVVECYSMLLGEYSAVLTNSRKLVVKLGCRMCTCRKWQMTRVPCCHALAVIVKANLWMYDFVHSMYKADRQRRIYNQVVHPMETHDMATVDHRTGRVVGVISWTMNTVIVSYSLIMDDSLADPIKAQKSQTQGTRSCRCFKCGVGHTRRTCRNPRADFNSNYEGDVVAVEDLLDGSWVPDGGLS